MFFFLPESKDYHVTRKSLALKLCFPSISHLPRIRESWCNRRPAPRGEGQQNSEYKMKSCWQEPSVEFCSIFPLHELQKELFVVTFHKFFLLQYLLKLRPNFQDHISSSSSNIPKQPLLLLLWEDWDDIIVQLCCVLMTFRRESLSKWN